jgi:hypothetical protein
VEVVNHGPRTTLPFLSRTGVVNQQRTRCLPAFPAGTPRALPAVSPGEERYDASTCPSNGPGRKPVRASATGAKGSIA